MNQIEKQIQQAVQVENFLRQYGQGYSKREVDYIRKYWKEGLKSKFPMDILRQIYTELGFFRDDENIYLGFIDILENNFDIDRDIIEVGCGRFPALAKIIALKQHKGTITVYDPRLATVESKIPNMKLKRENFTKSTPVRSDQLVIGFMPCEATEQTIVTAGKNKADFLIALCEGGPHGDEFDYFESEDEWITSMIYTARLMATKNDLGTIEITDLKQYGDPYPVIYNKRRNSR